jgi:hypothetical protein
MSFSREPILPASSRHPRAGLKNSFAPFDSSIMGLKTIDSDQGNHVGKLH